MLKCAKKITQIFNMCNALFLVVSHGPVDLIGMIRARAIPDSSTLSTRMDPELGTAFSTLSS